MDVGGGADVWRDGGEIGIDTHRRIETRHRACLRAE